METSTGFGAEDAKLRVTRRLATSRGSGSEGHGRPSRPAPPLPTPRLPEGARAGGHLLPAAGRGAPGAGARRLTPHPRPPARALGVAARTPRGSRDTPARPPSGQPGLSPPHPRLRAVLSPNYRGAGAGRVGRPRRGRQPAGAARARSWRAASPAHSPYSCKVNPRRVTAARPRTRARLGRAPQSPPSSAPSSRRRGPGSASCKMSTPRAERGGRAGAAPPAGAAPLL